jgi:hypothetical protein
MSGESAREESARGGTSDEIAEDTERTEAGEGGEAASVTLSFQSGLSDWNARRLRDEAFHDVVRAELDRVAVGDATVLDHEVGCCGWIIARLRVEAVEGGSTVGSGTEIELVRREESEEE